MRRCTNNDIGVVLNIYDALMKNPYKDISRTMEILYRASNELVNSKVITDNENDGIYIVLYNSNARFVRRNGFQHNPKFKNAVLNRDIADIFAMYPINFGELYKDLIISSYTLLGGRILNRDLLLEVLREFSTIKGRYYIITSAESNGDLGLDNTFIQTANSIIDICESVPDYFKVIGSYNTKVNLELLIEKWKNK